MLVRLYVYSQFEIHISGHAMRLYKAVVKESTRRPSACKWVLMAVSFRTLR